MATSGIVLTFSTFAARRNTLQVLMTEAADEGPAALTSLRR
jgi:hypothetical protein